ncbi:GatB/YqeY domain-containing protein [Sulfurovum sp. zt1-1]|uniref:GatB/YqeY domain-containing protein n=1 Tax=Sulfurovum zhangzhouensis TaxID=3019067 RepID=A0ABT7QW29_9BACT|nr:GatB/YqeY domain-containing protein [Sulfurovum zhangzhouensis]MDM5271039.1 GatB/YqeY domain-containing protein [Sulfurovum zhangzhouensis]
MSLKEQIKNDIKEAMRAKDIITRDTLRNIQASIKQVEVDERKEVTDSDVEAILAKYLKQREDAKAQFLEAGRDDLVAKEAEEIAIVQSYLPEPMSDEELESTIKEIITQVGAESMKDMGKVMGAAKNTIGNRADGARINQVVKQILS